MGREIRRVPEGWDHPKDDRGHFKPLYDKSYEEAAQEWLTEFRKWDAGERPTYWEEGDTVYFWDWSGVPPTEEDDSYRPLWKEEDRTHYQMYETVTEGTPVSPVFEFPEQLEDWLVSDYGYSRTGAQSFVKCGWMPSGMFTPSAGLLSGSDLAEFMEKDNAR